MDKSKSQKAFYFQELADDFSALGMPTLACTLNDYAKIGTESYMNVSPDGKMILFLKGMSLPPHMNHPKMDCEVVDSGFQSV